MYYTFEKSKNRLIVVRSKDECLISITNDDAMPSAYSLTPDDLYDLIGCLMKVKSDIESK